MENRTEEIERYIEGVMSAEEKASFERRMDADSNLKESVTLQTSIIKSIQQIGQKQDALTMSSMQSLSAEDINRILNPPAVKKTHNLKFIFAVAAIAISTVMAFSLRTVYDNYQIEKLYSAFYAEYSIEEFRGQYQEDMFYEAMTFWREKKEKESIALLEEIANDGDIHPHYQDACWYLGLFYLKVHDTKGALTIFMRISSENGFYAEKANDILAKLKDM